MAPEERAKAIFPEHDVLLRGGGSARAAIADAIRAAEESMRERCAKVCYDADKSTHPTDLGDRIREVPT